jgi:hypothetical protein
MLAGPDLCGAKGLNALRLFHLQDKQDRGGKSRA